MGQMRTHAVQHKSGEPATAPGQRPFGVSVKTSPLQNHPIAILTRRQDVLLAHLMRHWRRVKAIRRVKGDHLPPRRSGVSLRCQLFRFAWTWRAKLLRIDCQPWRCCSIE
jgi:hypothetical protein